MANNKKLNKNQIKLNKVLITNLKKPKNPGFFFEKGWVITTGYNLTNPDRT